jgi:hypothetical protein
VATHAHHKPNDVEDQDSESQITQYVIISQKNEKLVQDVEEFNLFREERGVWAVPGDGCNLIQELCTFAR